MSLNDILPDPITPRDEQLLVEALKAKLKVAAGLAVALLHAMERRFGPAAREVLRELAQAREPSPRPQAGDPSHDLHAFCDALERDCVGSHRWERVVDEPRRIAYRFTRCLWAEVFRELGEPELGWLLCAGDEPAARAYNPHMRFRRTQVLMCGDEICDHEFYVEETGARAPLGGDAPTDHI